MVCTRVINLLKLFAVTCKLLLTIKFTIQLKSNLIHKAIQSTGGHIKHENSKWLILGIVNKKKVNCMLRVMVQPSACHFKQFIRTKNVIIFALA